ncbi:MAG: hypothetical protein OXH08_07100 [Gammaproteobacteria bacterium]|nr:hypothetical protein [Gammaproteobacteria bacterium]
MFRSLMGKHTPVDDAGVVLRVPIVIIIVAVALAIALTPDPVGVDCSDPANATHIDCGGG